MVCISMKYNLNGQKIGKWTVIKEVGKQGSGDIKWLCQCECGRYSKVNATYLVHGKSKRCSYCNAHAKRWYPTDRIPEQYWKHILSGAKKRDIPISISPEKAYEKFIEQDRKCALSEETLCFPKCATEWKNYPSLPSLDRIDNNKGYISGNIQWLHKDVNRMKNVHRQDYFVELCKKIAIHASPK